MKRITSIEASARTEAVPIHRDTPIYPSRLWRRSRKKESDILLDIETRWHYQIPIHNSSPRRREAAKSISVSRGIGTTSIQNSNS